MFKYVFSIVLACSFLLCDAQQLRKVKIDEHLTVYFPSIPDSFRQMGMKIFVARNDSLVFQALVNDSLPLNTATEKDFQIALQGMSDGFSKKLEFFSIGRKDTIIGEAKGLFLTAKNEKSSLPINEVYAFLTIVNSHGYMIQLASGLGGLSGTTVEKYFNNIRFKGENYLETQSIAYRIGYMIGGLVVIAIIVGIIIFVVRLLT